MTRVCVPVMSGNNVRAYILYLVLAEKKKNPDAAAAASFDRSVDRSIEIFDYYRPYAEAIKLTRKKIRAS